MITANNGILIVAMLFAWGIHTNDKWLVLLALASASFSWAANFAQEQGVSHAYQAAALVAVVSAAVGIIRHTAFSRPLPSASLCAVYRSLVRLTLLSINAPRGLALRLVVVRLSVGEVIAMFAPIPVDLG
jgi:hypothetical protein